MNNRKLLEKRWIRPIVNFCIPIIFLEFKNVIANSPSLQADIPELKYFGKKTAIWILFSEAALVAQMYPIKIIMDMLNTNNALVPLILLGIFVSVLYCVGALINNRMNIWRHSFTQKLFVTMWAEAQRAQLSMDVAWHLIHGTGEKESMIMKNVERSADFIESYFFEAIPIRLRIIITSCAMILLMKWFGLFAIILLIIHIVILQKIDNGLGILSQEYHKDNLILDQYGSQLNINCLTIKSMGLENHFAIENRGLLDWYLSREIPRHKVYRKLIMQPDQVVNLARGVVYILGAILTQLHELSIGSFVLASAWLERIFSNMYRLVEYQQKSRRGIPAVTELVTVFLVKPTVIQAKNPVWKDDWHGHIEFRDVYFRHNNSQPHTLSGINITIQPNTMVGIVGRTGSGKSTLLNLLQRTHDPESGTILIDGIDLRLIDRDRYRQTAIGVVHQHVQLFRGSIGYNIRITDQHGSDTQMREAAELAYADEFINKLPGQYDYQLSEGGTELSGGQQQRLGIARALHSKPSILILDEPTSALDSESQSRIQQSFDSLIKARLCTTFIIAHRFSTIQNADLIIVMDDGKIVEMGTHDELLRMNGFYHRLRMLDAEGGFASE